MNNKNKIIIKIAFVFLIVIVAGGCVLYFKQLKDIKKLHQIVNKSESKYEESNKLLEEKSKAEEEYNLFLDEKNIPTNIVIGTGSKKIVIRNAVKLNKGTKIEGDHFGVLDVRESINGTYDIVLKSFGNVKGFSDSNNEKYYSAKAYDKLYILNVKMENISGYFFSDMFKDGKTDDYSNLTKDQMNDLVKYFENVNDDSLLYSAVVTWNNSGVSFVDFAYLEDGINMMNPLREAIESYNKK